MYCKQHQIHFLRSCKECTDGWVPDWCHVESDREKDLNDWLRKYGGHTKECSVFGRASVRGLVSNKKHFDPENCDCGWKLIALKEIRSGLYV